MNEIHQLWWKLDEFDAILPNFWYSKWNFNVNGRICLVKAKKRYFLKRRQTEKYEIFRWKSEIFLFVRRFYQQRIIEKAKFTISVQCILHTSKIQYLTLFDVIWFDLCVWFTSFGWQNQLHFSYTLTVFILTSNLWRRHTVNQ